VRLSRLPSCMLAALLPLAANSQSPSLVPMREWKVPWEKTRPRDPAVAPDGRIFFVGQEGNYVARLDPRTGEFKRYEIDPGTFPHSCLVDARGQLWYSGNRNGMIGRLDPATGAITRFPIGDSAVKDPHTMVFDRQGNVWFTAQNSNVVGHLDAATGKYRIVRMPQANSRPYGIVLYSRGRPWFNLFGRGLIGTIDPVTYELRTYPLANEKTLDRRIAITSDDKLWYVDYARGKLGHLDPASGKTEEFATPGGPASLPYAMTSDDRDRIWFVETGKQPNRLVGFDPKTRLFFSSTAIEGGGGTVRHMVFDRKTRLIWFGTDNGTIVRADVPGEKTAM
jgi:virginiamycin B lyase